MAVDSTGEKELDIQVGQTISGKIYLSIAEFDSGRMIAAYLTPEDARWVAKKIESDLKCMEEHP